MKFSVLLAVMALVGCVTPPVPPSAPYAWWGDDDVGVEMQASLAASYEATRAFKAAWLGPGRSWDEYFAMRLAEQRLFHAFVTWKAARDWEPEAGGLR